MRCAGEDSAGRSRSRSEGDTGGIVEESATPRSRRKTGDTADELICWSTRVFGLAVAFIGLVYTPPAAAQSLDDAFKSAFEVGGPQNLAPLRQAGARFDHLGVAESLPGADDSNKHANKQKKRAAPYSRKDWLHEVTLGIASHKVRYPLKFTHTSKGWRPVWTPERTYAGALAQVIRGNLLPSLDPDATSEASRWSELERLPALPVVVAPERVITATGDVTLRRGAQPPKMLRGQVSSWIDDILQGDNGPAAVDVLASGDVQWNTLTAVLYAAAGAGMFRVNLIGRRGEDLVALPAAAPVFASGDTPDPDTSLLVGMYPADSGGTKWAFRVSVAGNLLVSDDACGSRNTFCMNDTSDFSTRLRTVFRNAFDERKPSISHVMFAATADVQVRRALPYIARLPAALGIPRSKLFLGYIGEAADLLPENRDSNTGRRR